MNILITGGTGLIGSALVKKLRAEKHEVRVVSRNKTSDKNSFVWNIEKNEIDEKAFENLDGIIHLAGASIGENWTEDYKKILYSSRIDSANLLLKTCKNLNTKLNFFISASGVNYYGTFTSDQILTENDGIIHQDFLAKLSEDWENAAYEFSNVADRIVCVRTAMVLAKNGGSFPMLKKVVDFNIGSAVGSGKQWMNWIHIDDLVNMYAYFVENSAANGNYNAVADEIETNKAFMRTLAKKSNKFFLPIAAPGFVLKIVFGEMSSIILEGTRASNEKIKSEGFKFRFPKLESALQELLK
ncbi:TIGR01777 family oxidoreductase [Frigoriflavimonas asaccharolytica]|uniref:TIGR01777 family protein n=1 Tax=Frigoriflavimonas asaccharolytica TaxID=2735899 RepID=A0A8J8G5L2_9FLAO|nr:TIGR01777 family oxidoreductase [Frigoriflavimonas asaccharolytica]NRS91674.1 hypothetical protein [Frigoriflavimonas asaccharolytica]